MQTDTPTISVIIPTYNRAHLVSQAIKSVLDQTYQDFEIIVVDDASTDNTEDVINGFNDPRIRYLRHQQNRGAPWARNSGAEAAQGDYLAFLDSDDIWLPEWLERQLSEFNKLPPSIGMICCGMIHKIGDRRKVVRPAMLGLTFDDHVIREGGIGTSSFLVRKAAFQAVGGFNVKLSSFQDLDFLLRMTKSYEVAAIDDILVECRLQKQGISMNMAAKAKGMEEIINIYRDEILRLEVMNRYLFKLGQFYILSGCLVTGWRNWIQALRYNPLDTKIWKHFLLTVGGVGLYKRALLLHNRLVVRRNTQ